MLIQVVVIMMNVIYVEIHLYNYRANELKCILCIITCVKSLCRTTGTILYIILMYMYIHTYIHTYIHGIVVFLSGREHHQLDLYIFQEVLDHIAHFDRILSSPRGALLLAGWSGVGRRTAVKLVAHLHHMEIITPNISRVYSVKSFKNDMKNVSYFSSPLVWVSS